MKNDMKNLIAKFLTWCLSYLTKTEPKKKTIKYRFLEILKGKGKSKRKDIINYILMAQIDVKKHTKTPYNALMYKDVSRGYYCTNLVKWVHIECIIEKDDNGLYSVSKNGLEYLKNPKSIKYANMENKMVQLKNHINYLIEQADESRNFNFAMVNGKADILSAIEYYKMGGFREELTSDKLFYLNHLLSFAEDSIGTKELKSRFGLDYTTERQADWFQIGEDIV